MRRPKIGDVFSINLENGWYGFGVSASNSDTIFVNHFSRGAAPLLEDISSAEILIRIIVNASAYNSAGWRAVGHIELPAQWCEPVSYWNRPIGQEQFFLVTVKGMRSATRDDVKGLEAAAAWYAPHVEDRLRANQRGESSLQEIWSRDPDLAPR